MNRVIVCLIATLVCIAITSPARAAANTFTNSDFKFSMEYPDGWNMKEETPDAESQSAATALGMSMPKMVSACFAEKKCTPGKKSKTPQLNLMIVDLKSAAKAGQRFKGIPKPGERNNAFSDTEKEERSPSCDLIEKGRRKWAGFKAPFTTVRCPEKKRWRYTTRITMKRKRSGMNNLYTLECSMRSKSKDKADSLTEYNLELKPTCEASIASSKMTK